MNNKPLKTTTTPAITAHRFTLHRNPGMFRMARAERRYNRGIMWREVRYSFRQWRQNKTFTAIVILLLGIGLGANALIFGFVNALLLKPLPVRDPGNLFLIEKMREKQVRPDDACNYTVYEQIRA